MAESLRNKPIVEPADDLLTKGRLRPSRNTVPGWEVRLYNCRVATFRPSPKGTVLGATGTGDVELLQGIRAWPNRRYRLDIHGEPLAELPRQRLAPGCQWRLARQCFPGSVGCVQVRFSSFKGDQEIRAYEPPVMEVGGDAPVIHRAFFQCPPGTGCLRIGLRFHASSPIVVQRIRLVECGDYLLTSHPLAVPPEPWREPPPCLPASVVLCDGRTDNRPLLAWLREVFGPSNVQRVAPGDLMRWHAHLSEKHCPPQAPCKAGGGLPESSVPATVVDLPAARAPRLPDLLAWSDRTIVVVSAGTFAGSARRAGLRGIRLQDRVSGVDMPCGKITLPGYFIRGFALADTIPYAWNDNRDSFAHRYLSITKRTQAKLDVMGIRPAIVTDCGQRDIDNRPLVLYRPGRNGALLVMDRDGLEAPTAGQDVPRIFDLIWRSALGRETVGLGQFSAPPTHYEGVMTDLVELARQYYEIVEDLSIPVRVRGRGNWPPIWLLPGRHTDRFTHRGVLHIRTGFAEADWPAVYGLLLWLKRVAVAAMREEPIGRMLLERTHLLAWPIAQPQNWRGCPADVTPPQYNMPAGGLPSRIDLRIGRQRQTVILVPDRQREAIVRSGLSGWPRPAYPAPRVRIDPSAFEDEALWRPGRTDTLVCKVLLPGIPQPHPANSPILTDLATALLERLAFATFGFIVPNRSWRPQTVDLRPLAAAARRVIQIRSDGRTGPVDVRRRRKIAVPAGGAIVGLS